MYFLGGNAVFLRKTLGTDPKRQKIPGPSEKGLGLKASHFSQRLSLSFSGPRRYRRRPVVGLHLSQWSLKGIGERSFDQGLLNGFDLMRGQGYWKRDHKSRAP